MKCFGIIGIFLAIFLALITYKIVVRNIVPKIGLDKKVYYIVEQKYNNVGNEINTSINVPENLKKYFDANVIINQTSTSNIEKITNFIVNAITIFILIIIYYIIIVIIQLFLNAVAELPILNSINSMGGLLIGVVKNMIIILILLTLLSFCSTIGKVKFLTEEINNSIITKKIYNSNFITKIIINIQENKDNNEEGNERF